MKPKNCGDCKNMKVKLPLKMSEEYLNAKKKIDIKSHIDWLALANTAFLQSRFLYREATAYCREDMIYIDPEKHKNTFKIGVLHKDRDSYAAWREAEHCAKFESMDD